MISLFGLAVLSSRVRCVEGGVYGNYAWCCLDRGDRRFGGRTRAGCDEVHIAAIAEG